MLIFSVISKPVSFILNSDFIKHMNRVTRDTQPVGCCTGILKLKVSLSQWQYLSNPLSTVKYFSHLTREYTLKGYKGRTCGSSGRWCRTGKRRWCWHWTSMERSLKRSIGTTSRNNTPSCAICGVVDHIFVVVFLPLINADTFCRLKQDIIPCYLKQSTLNVIPIEITSTYHVHHICIFCHELCIHWKREKQTMNMDILVCDISFCFLLSILHSSLCI